MSTPRQRGTNEAPAAAPAAAAPATTKTSSPKALTSERIASDIEAFNKAGGHIEVLGNTPFHTKPEKPEPDANAPAAKRQPGQK